MRALVVSTYPPKHCGIASYAAQEVAALRQDGHEVEVMSVDGEGAVDYPLRLADPDDADRALDIFGTFGLVSIHYASGLISSDDILAESSFGRLLERASKKRRRTRVQVLVHEIDYAEVGRWERRRRARPWRSGAEIYFHTSVERDRFARYFRSVPRRRLHVVEHGRHMQKFFHGTRAEARAALGIPHDQIAFVSCGYVQESKGFDRVVSIFDGATALPPEAHYHVVGSARTPEFIPYAESLAETAARVPAVTFHQAYLDDEAFDRWIVAADVIVAPYRVIFSSGVIARAALHDRPVIATDVGGLKEQVRGGDTVVADDDALARAIDTFARGRGARA